MTVVCVCVCVLVSMNREHLEIEVQQARLADFVSEYQRHFLRHPSSHHSNNNNHNHNPAQSSSSTDLRDIKPHSSLAKCLSHAIAAGYFMNTAMKCVNESVYKLLPLPTSTTKQAEDIQLVHILPQSAFAYVKPSDYLVYQDVLQNQKLFIRNVTKVSEKIIQQYRSAWQYVDPHILSQDDDLIALAKEKEEEARQRAEEDVKRKKRLREELSALEASTITLKNEEEEERSKRLKASTETLSAVEQARLRYLSRKK